MADESPCARDARDRDKDLHSSEYNCQKPEERGEKSEILRGIYLILTVNHQANDSSACITNWDKRSSS